MKWTLRQKMTLVSLFAVCILFAVYILHNNTILEAKSLMSFDPSDYALPLQIGGYQVIAAVPSENMSCAAPNGFELLLYPIPNEPQTLTREDLDKLEGTVGRHVQTSIAYRVMTFEEVRSLVEYLNKNLWPTGCRLIHSALVTLTPQPVSNPIIPPTPDNGSVILPATIVPTPTGNGFAISPPTPDTSSIIMPPTEVIDPNAGPFPTQNSPLIFPTFDGTPIASTTTYESYTPAYWGLPAQIGGYEIMVVIPSENQRCSEPNTINLLFHALPDQPQTLTTADIDQLETIVHRRIRLGFYSSVVTIEGIKSQTESWNAQMAGGCISLGGPIPSLTPPNPADAPAPQFLYRNANHLELVNGYTGESTELPIEVTEGDAFGWSPDGKYIEAKLHDGDNIGYCLNLYDPDKQEWLSSKPISCAVQESEFSADGSHLFYATLDTTNAKLWTYSIGDATKHELYITASAGTFSAYSLANLKWSPTHTYLTFEDRHFIGLGATFSLIILNVQTEKHITVNAPNIYYASYDPIWSADDYWFLVILKENYTGIGAEPPPKDQGDLYLVNSESGEQYRLTYTPANAKIDIHWTIDGKIAYTEVSQQKMTLTLDEAKAVKVVPADEIATPEPGDENAHDFMEGYIISPDRDLAAWVSQKSMADKNYRLNIGSILSSPPSVTFSVPISEPYQSGNVLIGWRPSTYPYLRG